MHMLYTYVYICLIKETYLNTKNHIYDYIQFFTQKGYYHILLFLQSFDITP